MSESKTAELDEDIRELKAMLKQADMKFSDKMKIYSQLQKLYNLRLKFSGSARGGAFKSTPTGSQS